MNAERPDAASPKGEVYEELPGVCNYSDCNEYRCTHEAGHSGEHFFAAPPKAALHPVGCHCESCHADNPTTLAPPPSDAAPPIEVVAAVRRDGERYWVCRRTDDGSHGGLAGMWEYPGGKVEQGETRQSALIREMREEFNVEAVIGKELDSVTTKLWDKRYRVTFFAVEFDGEPELRCHDATAWCTVDQLLGQHHLPSGTIFNSRLHDAPPSDAAPVVGTVDASDIKTWVNRLESILVYVEDCASCPECAEMCRRALLDSPTYADHER